MAEDQRGLDAVRRDACNFLRDDDWHLTESVERDARKLGYSQCGVADVLLEQLEAGFAFHEVPLGEPPGSGGIGYVLNDVGGQGLYIKFLLEWKYLKVFSFHVSKHFRND
jgi:hypothetical protein